MDTANNAENASIAQTIKTYDSLDTKIQKVKNSALSIALGTADWQDMAKGVLETFNTILQNLSKMGTGGILSTIIQFIWNIKQTVTNIFDGLKAGLESIAGQYAAFTQKNRLDIQTKLNNSEAERIMEAFKNKYSTLSINAEMKNGAELQNLKDRQIKTSMLAWLGGGEVMGKKQNAKLVGTVGQQIFTSYKDAVKNEKNTSPFVSDAMTTMGIGNSYLGGNLNMSTADAASQILSLSTNFEQAGRSLAELQYNASEYNKNFDAFRAADNTLAGIYSSTAGTKENNAVWKDVFGIFQKGDFGTQQAEQVSSLLFGSTMNSDLAAKVYGTFARSGNVKNIKDLQNLFIDAASTRRNEALARSDKNLEDIGSMIGIVNPEKFIGKAPVQSNNTAAYNAENKTLTIGENGKEAEAKTFNQKEITDGVVSKLLEQYNAASASGSASGQKNAIASIPSLIQENAQMRALAEQYKTLTGRDLMMPGKDSDIIKSMNQSLTGKKGLNGAKLNSQNADEISPIIDKVISSILNSVTGAAEKGLEGNSVANKTGTTEETQYLKNKETLDAYNSSMRDSIKAQDKFSDKQLESAANFDETKISSVVDQLQQVALTASTNSQGKNQEAIDKAATDLSDLGASAENVTKAFALLATTTDPTKSKEIRDQIVKDLTGFKDNAGGKIKNQEDQKQYEKYMQQQQRTARLKSGARIAGSALQVAGSAFTTAGLARKDTAEELSHGREYSKLEQSAGGILSAGGSILNGFAMGGLTGGIASAIGQIPNVITSIKNAIDGFNVTTKELYDTQKSETEEAKNDYLSAKNSKNNLSSSITKLESLKDAMFDSEDAYSEYIDYMNELSDSYPDLVSHFDAENNAIINLTDAYKALIAAQADESQEEFQFEKENSELNDIQYQNITDWKEGMKDNGTSINFSDPSFLEGVFAGIEARYGPSSGNGLSVYQQEKQGIRATGKDSKDYVFTEEEAERFQGLGILSNIDTSAYGNPVFYGQTKINGAQLYDLLSSEELGFNINEMTDAEASFLAALLVESLEGVSSTDAFKTITGSSSEELSNLFKNQTSGKAALSRVSTIFGLYYNYGEEYSEESNINAQKAASSSYSKYRMSNYINDKSYEMDSAELKSASEIATDSFLSGDLFKQNLIQAYAKSIDSEVSAIDMNDADTVENYGNWLIENEDEIDTLAESFYGKLLEGYSIIGEDGIAEIEKILSNADQYSSVEAMFADLAPYESMLRVAGLWEEIEQYGNDYYEEATLSARKIAGQSFLRNGYSSYDENKKLFYYKTDGSLEESYFGNANISNDAISMANLFNGQLSEIATAYSDSIVKQWNSLVYTPLKNGLVTSAEESSDFLVDAYQEIASLGDDSEVAGSYAKLMSSADLTTVEGIQETIGALEEIVNDDTKSAQEKNVASKLIKRLNDRMTNLYTNINTSVTSMSTAIDTAEDNMDDVISAQSKGVGGIKKANTALNKINTKRKVKGKENLDFNSVFKWSEAIGDYVYTSEGIIESIKAEQGNIDETYAAAEKSAYANQDISNMLEAGATSTIDSSEIYSEDNAAEIEKILKNGYNAENEGGYSEKEYDKAVESMISEWQNSDNQSWSDFYLNYVEAHKEELEKLGIIKSSDTNYLYSSTRKDLLSQVDFSSLTSGGLDLPSEKETFKNNLTAYIDVRREEIAKLEEEDEFLSQNTNTADIVSAIMAGGANAASVYKSAMDSEDFDFSTMQSILTQNSSQYSTAITELLSGPGKAISQTTSQILQASSTGSQLLSNEGLTLNGNVQGLIDQAVELYAELSNQYAKGETDLSTLNSQYQAILEKQFEQDSDIISTLSSSDSMDISSFTTIVQAFGGTLDSIFDSNGDINKAFQTSVKALGGGKFRIVDFDGFIDQIGGTGVSDVTSEEYLKAVATARNAVAKNTASYYANTVASGMDSVSNETVAGIAALIGTNFDDAVDQLKLIDNGNGTYTATATTIRTLVEGFNLQLTDELKASVASIIDNNNSQISTVLSDMTSGVSSVSEMQSLINTINTLTGGTYTLKSFSYDDTLGTFVLSSNLKEEAINAYVMQTADELKALGYHDEEIQSMIENELQVQLSTYENNIDASSFIQSQNETNKAAITKSLQDYTDTASALGYDIDENFADSMVERLESGGEEAMSAVASIAKAQGKTLSTSDYETAYKSEVTALQSIKEELGKGVNSIISAEAADIIRQSKAGVVSKIAGTDSYLINSIDDISKAYIEYYLRLAATGEATASEINAAAVDAINANQSPETSIMTILDSATGFGIDSLQTLGDNLGFLISDIVDVSTGKVTDEWSQIISYSGNGDYRIDNWDAFLATVEELTGDVIDKTSQAYLDAYASWAKSDAKLSMLSSKSDLADALIENATKVSSSAMEEARSLIEGKKGDKINITYLEEQLTAGINGINGESDLNNFLNQYGIAYKDGVATIVDQNVQSLHNLATELANKAESTGDQELLQTANEVKDGLLDLLNGYADTLSSAMTGDIGYIDAQNLSDLFGLNLDESFTETGKGLQISQQAATDIYLQLKAVDELAANIMLDNMIDNGKMFGEGIENASDLMYEIAEAEDEIASKQREINVLEKGGGDSERLATLKAETAELEKQVQLYKDMQVAMLDDPDQWKLSDQDLSDPIQSALNAWGSAGDWMKALNTASKSGDTHNMLGVQDFTNMVNFVAQNVEGAAENFMGSGMTASQLIQKGYSAIKSVDGEEYVDLSSIGVNFLSGSEDMGTNIAKGINNLAQSQISMLDGIIAMLEVIVAMEQLGDIDANDNGILEFGEFFKQSATTGAWELTEGANKLKEAADKDSELKDALDTIYFGKDSLYSLLSDPEKVAEWSPEEQEAFSQMMTSMFDLTNLDDWDPTSVQAMWEKFKGTALSDLDGIMTFDNKDGTFTDLFSGITWDFDPASEMAKSIAEQFSLEDTSEINAALAKYHAGKSLTIDESLMALEYEGDIEFKDNKYVLKGPDGEELGTYDDANEALLQAQKIAKEKAGLDNGGEVKENTDTGTKEYTYKINKDTNASMTEYITAKGKIMYRAEGADGSVGYGYSENEAIEKMLLNYLETNNGVKDTNGDGVIDLSDYTDDQVYTAKTTTGVDVESDVHINKDTVDTSSASWKSQAAEIYSMGAKAIQEAIDSGDENFKVKLNNLGIELGEGATGQDVVDLLGSELNIEDKTVSIAASVTASGDTGVIALIESDGTITKNLNVVVSQGNPNDLTNGDKDGQSDGTGSTLSTITQVVDVITNGDGSNIFNGIQNGSLNDLTQTVHVKTDGDNTDEDPQSTTKTVETDYTTDIDTSGIDSGVDAVSSAASSAGSSLERIADATGNIKDKSSEVKKTADAINKLKSKTITARFNGVINGHVHASINAPGASYTTDVSATTSKSVSFSSAKGNVALASGNALATGNAKSNANNNYSKGKTLMGELGPELVVAEGKYFTVGDNGAEFVDLPKDAIVFNHKQTNKLLNGKHAGHGSPVVSENASISMATGNVSGPAMASAAAALAQMKELRAMWASLASASASDLGRKAGGGGGGGGGGGNSDNSAYIGDLERWYNLLKQIETLENEINLAEKERENLIHSQLDDGTTWTENIEAELKSLDSEVTKYKELRSLAKDYQEQRASDLKSSEYGKILEVLDDGTVQYKDSGFKLLAELNATKDDGVSAKYTAKQQLAMIKAAGFDTSLLSKKSDGTKAESDADKVQVFWDNIDTWKEEMEDLQSSVNEYSENIEDAASKIHDLEEELEEKQKSVEDMLMTALTDKLQASIDDMQDAADKMKDASDDYIEGLTDALDKEKSMYEAQSDNSELVKLQRQLAILQRTGGSASEIASLQDQINGKLQDSYFDKQQEQIDLIQEAADKQQEALEREIEIQTESLEYQKEHGLLWNEVYQMMNTWSVSELGDFIQANTADLQGLSSLDLGTKMNDNLVAVQAVKKILEDGGIGVIVKEAEEEVEGTGDSSTTEQTSEEKEKAKKEWLESTGLKSVGDSSDEKKKYDEKDDLKDAVAKVKKGSSESYGTSSQLTKYLTALQSGKLSKKEVASMITSLKNMKNDYKGNEAMQKAIDSVIDYADDYTSKGIDKSKNINSVVSSAKASLQAARAKDRTYQLYKGVSENYTGDSEKDEKMLKAMELLYLDTDSSDYTDAMLTPYSDSSFGKKKKQKWTNAKGKSTTGKLPKGTVLNVIGFTGDKNTSGIKAEYIDPKGNSHTGYFKGYSNVWKKDELETIRDYYNGKLPQYAAGGLVDFTGPAWVDGTKTKPEAFLSSSDYDLLKSKIFSDSDYSLRSTIDMISGLTDSMSKSSSLVDNSGNGITFGNVNLTIESGVISSDYDAQRAGDNIIQEMLNIARKSGNLTISR